jgi:hypothetical protein
MMAVGLSFSRSHTSQRLRAEGDRIDQVDDDV